MIRTILLALAFLLVCIKAIAQDGAKLFDDTFLHEIRFTQVDTSIYIGTKDYQQVVIQVDGEHLDSIGIKRKGNISGYPQTNKFGIKIKTNKYISGREYDDIKEWTLHMNYQDPSMLREKLTYDLCRDLGLYSLRTAFARVYINDSYWGVFTIVEGKDEMYKHVFKNRDADAVESLDFGDMCYYESDPDFYFNEDFPYYKVENGNGNTAKSRFVEMLEMANNAEASDYVDQVSQYFNIRDFMRYQALNVYLLNFDSYIAFRGNQIYVFDSIQNIWQVTPWDFNASFGLWNTNNDSPEDYPFIPGVIENGCIAGMINTVPEMKNYYLDAMCELHSILGETTEYFNKIDRLADQIRDAVYADYRKVATNQDFENALGFGYNEVFFENQPALKTLVETRSKIVSEALSNENYACLLSSSNSIPFLSGVSLGPNPTDRYVYFIDGIKDYDMFRIIDVNGNNLKNGKVTDDFIDLGSFPDGIYFIMFTKGKSTEACKIIKSGNY